MAQGFVHVNGVTYQLTRPMSDSAIQQLAEHLQPKSKPDPASNQPVRFAVRNDHLHHLEVTKDGHSFSLAVDTYRVWGAGVWLAPENA